MGWSPKKPDEGGFYHYRNKGVSFVAGVYKSGGPVYWGDGADGEGEWGDKLTMDEIMAWLAEGDGVYSEGSRQ